MMAVEITGGRPARARILKAEDSAEGLGARNRDSGDNECLQQDRVKRDQADQNSFCVQAMDQRSSSLAGLFLNAHNHRS